MLENADAGMMGGTMMHKKNFLRLIGRLLCCLLVSSFLAQGTALAAQPGFLSNEQWEVLSLTNEERAKQGLAPLSTFPALADVGQLRSGEITGTFSHTRPDGTSCFTALSGIPYYSAGENIAAGYPSPQDVVTGWMNSPGHRANILTERFRHLGVGYTKGSGSDKYRSYWAQLFIGGCDVTGMEIDGAGREWYIPYGKLGDPVLCITCDLHGKTYLPLSNADWVMSNELGKSNLQVRYDGRNYTIPCYIGFSDVAANSWYREAVCYAKDNGLFQGVSYSTFEPASTMTRSMLAAVLYRMEGSPAVSGETPFDDVKASSWYGSAVRWAAENGIVKGISDTRFAPDVSVTREQMATMLARYHSYKGGSTASAGDLTQFTDWQMISSYAENALSWAVSCGLMNGKGNKQLDPGGKISRAEVAAILMRYQTR